MAGRLDGERQVVLAGAEERGLDVGGAGGLDDGGRTRIDRAVPGGAVGVVARLAGHVDLPTEGAAEMGDDGHAPETGA